ncbi:MAG: DHH family phosphoesterase [Oscillospiraceae bacterium]|nr:DHH family phosphoesterase [Oscillospiraceae bacterium]
MHKKLSRLIEPNLQPYFLCFLLFILAALLVEPVLAAVETVVLLLLYIFYRNQSHARRRSIMQFVETLTGGVDSISKNSMLNTPLPVVVFRADNGEIIWTNAAFMELTEAREGVFDMRIGDLAPCFRYQCILDGEKQDPELTEMNGSVYQIYGAAGRMSGRAASQGIIVTAYFVDVTEREHMRSVYDASRPVVTLLVLDNYEELLKAGGEAAKSAVLAQIDERINAWVQNTGGMLRKFDRDRYLFICDEQSFEQLAAEKFSLLESIHQVVSEDGVNASLSIGAGKDCDTYEEALQWAGKSIEMALSRGGDQAVVKDSLDFQFYGGRAKSSEKRTKVKSRVMAKALGDLIADASQVYVMGHEYADMDAVGAAAGICCAARKRGKKAQVVIDLEGNNAQALVRHLADQPEYAGAFVSGPDAFVHAQAGALLVVVDTNRPDLVEHRQLLDACNRVAVIDHHRRAAVYIENAALNFHEPYASSASELVTELLQYMAEPSDLLPAEADALLAGIVLDTKNFSMRAGGRTFEAAAFLRRAGADTAEVRRYFQSDLPSMIARYDIIRTAKMVHGDIAVAVAEREVSRVTAAKAADDLLTLKGVQASIVLYGQGDGISMSGRSLGEINVQVILESLGGGGNATSAGGHIPNIDAKTVHQRLLAAIDRYYQ